jgi:nitroreductase
MLKLLAKEGILRRIVESAAAAPSIHNTQPWRFVVPADDILEVRADLDRALWVADPKARALYLSCGAAIFNVRTAIRTTGFNPRVWLLPHNYAPLVLAVVQAEPGRPASYAEGEMYQAIWQRHTNRAPYTDEAIPESVRVALEQAASSEYATLRMLTSPDTATVLDLARQAGAELAGDVEHQIELQDWIATGSGWDGIPASALPSRPRTAAAGPVREDLAAARPAVHRPSQSYEHAPQLAVLTTPGDEPGDWLRAGQALQRVLLTATARSLSASFLYQPIELRDMRGDAATSWPWRENPQIIIRLGYGSEPARTLRRPLQDILTRSAPAVASAAQ